MDVFSAPSTCRISAHIQYRIATVATHEHTLIRVQRGTKTLLSATASEQFHSGQILIMPLGSVCDVINDPRPDTRYAASVLEFGDSALNTFVEQHPTTDTTPQLVGYAVPTINTELTQSVSRAMDTISRPGASAALKQHRVLEVLLLLAEQGIRLEPRTELRWQDRLRRLVTQRPYANWSVAVLADVFHVSPATLRRRVAAEGTRVGDLVRETRLEIALSLLQTTPMAIGEIAQRCGYESHSRFTAAFRDRFGLCPSDLRLPEHHGNPNVSAQ